MSTLSRHVSAPRGADINCKGWPQEAAMRMLMNNLDPEVAERPDALLQRVLTCDPGSSVVRHADAGYPDAIQTARERGIDMPMLPGNLR